jgi:hypothetical protein
MDEGLKKAWFKSQNELSQWSKELASFDWKKYSRKEKQFVLNMIADCKFKEREIYRKLYG